MDPIWSLSLAAVALVGSLTLALALEWAALNMILRAMGRAPRSGK